MSNSRGIAILFHDNFDFKIHDQVSDNSGNYLVFDITIECKKIILLVIYGPNEDCPKFYEDISIINAKFNDDVIMAGYFGLILDPNKDYFNYLQINNPRARQVLNK